MSKVTRKAVSLEQSGTVNRNGTLGQVEVRVPHEKAVRQAFTIVVINGKTPLRDVLVRIQIPRSNQVMVSRTNVRGEAVFYGLRKNGKYTISLRGNGLYVKTQEIMFKGYDVYVDVANVSMIGKATIVFIARDGIYQTPISGVSINSNVMTNYNADTKVTDDLGESAFEFDILINGPIQYASFTYNHPALGPVVFSSVPLSDGVNQIFITI